MRLSPGELASFLKILDKIDNGEAAPRIGGPLGLYLRQYSTGRALITSLLMEQDLVPKARGWVSTDPASMLSFHPIGRPWTNIGPRQIGESTQALGFSEELGFVIHGVFWHGSPSGASASHLLKSGSHLELDGEARWTPPNRLTSGSARVKKATPKAWHEAALLRATSDDLGRPPHALEYVVDATPGHMGIKYIRSICAIEREGTWFVTPGFGEMKPYNITFGKPPPRIQAPVRQLLVYREPWGEEWRVIDSRPIDTQTAFAHTLAWAIFRATLTNDVLSQEQLRALRLASRHAGLTVEAWKEPAINPPNAVGRQMARELKGIN